MRPIIHKRALGYIHISVKGGRYLDVTVFLSSTSFLPRIRGMLWAAILLPNYYFVTLAISAYLDLVIHFIGKVHDIHKR